MFFFIALTNGCDHGPGFALDQVRRVAEGADALADIVNLWLCGIGIHGNDHNGNSP